MVDETENFVRELMTNQRIFAREQGRYMGSLARDAAEILNQQFVAPNADFLQDPAIQPLTQYEAGIRELIGVDIDIDAILEDLALPDLVEPRIANKGSINFGQDLGPPRVTHQVGSYRLPTAPQQFNEEVPDINTDFDIPEVPDLGDVEQSELLDITLPEAPVITIPDRYIERPQFQGKVPEGTGQAYIDKWRELCGETFDKMNNQIQCFMEQYFPDMEQVSSLSSDYIKDFISGNKTAISNALEEQLYTRARNRVDIQAMQELDDVRDLARETDNPIMPLRVRAGLLRINDQAAGRKTEAVISLAEQRAKLEVEQIQFVLGQALELRQIAMTSRSNEMQVFLQANKQAMEASETFVQLLYRELDAFVAIFREELSAYEAELKQLQADREFTLAELEVYKGRLEGERLKAQINSQLIDQDANKVRLLEARYSAIESRIRGILAQAELRKVPLDVFIAKVQAHTAYLDSIKGEVDIVRALIDGDVATIEGQVAQVQAWTEEKKLELIDLEKDKLELDQIETYNRAKIQLYESRARRYAIALEIAKQTIDVRKVNVDSDTTKFQTFTDAYLREYEIGNNLRLRASETNAKYAEAYERIVLGFQELLQRNSEAIATIQVEAAKGFGQIGAAAMNGINQLVGVNVNKTVT